MNIGFTFANGKRKYVIGTDLSHHNFEFAKTCLNPAGLDFIFLKASEGRSFKDPKCAEFMSLIGNNMNLDCAPYVGFYHYAHAEYANPLEEADFFLQTLKGLYVGDNIMYMLDIEGDSFENKKVDDWAHTFLSYVEKETGKVPFIYVQSSMTGKFPRTAKDYPLWLAQYKKKSMESPIWCDFWKEPKIWQFTTIPYDLDMAFVDRKDFHLWCTGNRQDLKAAGLL